jgi:2-amino-4-hydroxy-6-hydroxymethyldihydropteridine diphosphokinase
MKMIQAAIALGSNLGDSLSILEKALQTLAQNPKIRVKICSSWYQTTPIGPPQPDYLNGCAIVQTQLTAHQLLDILLETEQQFGRVRQEKWGPRTLDLDLLLYDNLILNTPNLQIPHPRMRERAFVLIPLAEIAANWIDPVTGTTIINILKTLDTSGVFLYSNQEY